MSDVVEDTPLRALVEPPVAGFWGQPARTVGASNAARVIRNGDVREDRDILVEELPIRWLTSRELNRARVEPDDVVVVASGYIGKSGRLVGDPGEHPVVVSNFVRRLRGSGDVEPRWLYQLLGLPTAIQAMLRNSGGTTITNLSSGYLDDFNVWRPRREEQRWIAGVLDSVDESIATTADLVAKLSLIRHALLRDLLQKGIDDRGRVRDPVARPSAFKDSPLGLIPKTWDVAPVENLLADVSPAMRSGPFGSALLKQELVSEGVPLLGIDNVHVERFVPDYTRFVRPQKARELARYRVRPNDVMITIMGTVGRCCLVPEDVGEALSSKHVWTLTVDHSRYSPFLVCLQFNYAPWVLSHFRRDEQGGIMSAIRSDTLRTTLLPVPPRDEQGRIEGVLRLAFDRFVNERESLDKLRTLKAGLMNDLLRGRVRLPADGRDQ